MTEGQRRSLHQLLDRMIDEGLEYGVCEYAKISEWEPTKSPSTPSSLTVWKTERTRMELTLKLRDFKS